MVKIVDKLTKINDSFTVHIYDNGYMVEVSGRDSENEYKTAKIMCSSVEDLLGLIDQTILMPVDN